MSRFTRRALIGLGAVFVASGAAYGAGLLWCRTVPRANELFIAGVDENDTRALATVGERVRRSVPRLAEESGIRTVLAARPRMAQVLASDCPLTRRALIEAQCADDFHAGDTVTVDGWLLSTTEAALCASLTV